MADSHPSFSEEMGEYVLALDEGTSSARAVLFDRQANEVGVAQAPFKTYFPKPGWVEQDALEIWQTQRRVIDEVVQQTSISISDVHAIGITNQRETTVIWDRKTGQPIAPAIVWQCRRTSDWCDDLKSQAVAAQIQDKTGLVVDAYFSASKIGWLLDHVPDARSRAHAGELVFGTIDTWLIYNLTKGRKCVIDRTNASRTMLMDLYSGQWSDEMLNLFDIPRALLPDIVPSAGISGYCAAEVLGAELPIAGIAGDQQAALIGQSCTHRGETKNTFGTGCFLLMHTGMQPAKSKNQLLATAAASLDANHPEFAIEGSVFDAGTAMQWLRDELGLLENVSHASEIATSISDTGGVWVVPAFTGLGAPHWQSNVRATLLGITRGTGKAQIIRAALESIALQTLDLISAMESDTGISIPELKVDGGAANNAFLMQFQADILGKPVIKPQYVETTVRGAGLLAGLATNFYSEFPTALDSQTYTPSISADQRESIVEGWHKALRAAMSYQAD